MPRFTVFVLFLSTLVIFSLLGAKTFGNISDDKYNLSFTGRVEIKGLSTNTYIYTNLPPTFEPELICFEKSVIHNTNESKGIATNMCLYQSHFQITYFVGDFTTKVSYQVYNDWIELNK